MNNSAYTSIFHFKFNYLLQNPSEPYFLLTLYLEQMRRVTTTSLC